MALKITPGTGGSIVSDGHVVLLPAGLTGEVTLGDGTTVDLGPASQIAIEVDSHDQAKEVALAASQLAHDDESLPGVAFDESTSRKNLNIKKKG